MTVRPGAGGRPMPDGPVFVKLGGALLTDKAGHEAARPEILRRACDEVARWASRGAGALVVGHGSGSYAHVAVRETGFLDDPTPLAAARVAAAARRLNALVVEALLSLGVPATPLPAAAWASCVDGDVVGVRADIVDALLAARLVPVIYGDTAPDRVRGAAIASTEPLLLALALALHPRRIVLATDVDGVYTADPRRDRRAAPIERITPADAADVLPRLSGADHGATDVTGGMRTKVASMLVLVGRLPDLEVRIVSGLRPGAILAALAGEPDAGGTVIASR